MTPPPAILGLRPSLPGDLSFVWEFINFMILSKGISSSQRLKSSLDIFFLFVRNFAKKFSSCSFGSYLFGVEFSRNFFCRFKNLVKTARIFLFI